MSDINLIIITDNLTKTDSDNKETIDEISDETKTDADNKETIDEILDETKNDEDIISDMIETLNKRKIIDDDKKESREKIENLINNISEVKINEK